MVVGVVAFDSWQREDDDGRTKALALFSRAKEFLFAGCNRKAVDNAFALRVPQQVQVSRTRECIPSTLTSLLRAIKFALVDV